MLRGACANAQTRKSIRCSNTKCMDVDKDSDQVPLDKSTWTFEGVHTATSAVAQW